MEDRRIEVQSAVARTLAEFGDLDEAGPALLESIGAALGWELGAMWEIAEDVEELRSVATWQAPGIEARGFEQLTREMTFERGIGLPGRVWSSNEPAWIEDVVVDRNFARARAARKAGLHAALGFPLRSARGPIGVIEFFTREPARPDPALLETIATLGDLLGQYLERRRVDEAIHASEARKAAVLDAAIDCVITMDHTGRVVEFNPAAEKTFGYAAADAVGREMADLIVPPHLRERHRRGLARYLETGKAAVLGKRLELTGMRSDGAEFPVELTITRMPMPGPPLFTGFVRDITERRRLEDVLMFLDQASALLAESLDFETTLANVARSAVPVMADWCVVDVVNEEGLLERVAAAHSDPDRQLDDELWQRYPPRLDVAGLLDPSAISVPLRGQRGVLGVITMISEESGRRFDDRDVALAAELGRRAANAVDNGLLYRERSTIARTLQQSLLPAELPQIGGLELAARFRPAGEGIEVGGDFYDVFPVGGDRWALTIGDVVGKGPTAAALTALVRYTLRAVAPDAGSPAGTLRLLNDAIRRQSSAHEFCTAAFALLDPTPGRTRIVLATGGHPLPLVLRADGGVEQAGAPGTLLGVAPEVNLEERTVELWAGDSLVLYTDGVTDARAPERVLDDDELATMLADARGLDAAAIAARLEDGALEGFESRDDVAILVLQVPGAGRPSEDRDLGVVADDEAVSLR